MDGILVLPVQPLGKVGQEADLVALGKVTRIEDTGQPLAGGAEAPPAPDGIDHDDRELRREQLLRQDGRRVALTGPTDPQDTERLRHGIERNRQIIRQSQSAHCWALRISATIVACTAFMSWRMVVIMRCCRSISRRAASICCVYSMTNAIAEPSSPKRMASR